jgi:ceramide glucosyltransferase
MIAEPSEILALISAICAGCAVLGCLYLLIAAVAVLRFQPDRGSTGAALPITILSPLRGREPGLAQRLAALAGQRNAEALQVVCGVQDSNDPAVAVAHEFRRRHPSVDLVIDPRRRGANGKISNLLNMVPLAKHDCLIMADSDIEVQPDFVAKMTGTLQSLNTGAATCLYYGIAPANLWSRQGALSINTHFLPNAIVALTFKLTEPCFGGVIAINRATLSRLGGLDAFVDCLADDYAIGQAVRSTGQRVAIAPAIVAHACWHVSFSDFAARELRSAVTIRSIAPIGQLGSIVTHPFPMALLAALFGRPAWIAVAVFALVCRGAVAWAVQRRFSAPHLPYRLIPLHDLLAFGVWIGSLFAHSVTWKGHRYGLSAVGRKRAARLILNRGG